MTKVTRRIFMANTGIQIASMSVFSRLSARTPASEPTFSLGEYRKIDAADRRFHISAGCEEILNSPTPEARFDADPAASILNVSERDLPTLWKEAGVTDVWLNPYGAGTWRYDWATLDRSIERARSLGMTVHFITVPLGHPANEPNQAMAEKNWKPVRRPNGTERWGCSCHAPADRECVDSVRKIADRYGACDVFLDDDYRFAESPTDIGGCFCPECWADFTAQTGFPDAERSELIDDLKANRATRGVRLWVDYFCDRLTRVFHETEAASPEVDLGVMVMGMGSERAGIRLDDYRGRLFRVGEWMFSDKDYGTVKGKSIELFSSLFHRRFTTPGRVFSETTIIQPLSVANYASKLAVSTFCDVRNTMFMCPIPADYWSVLAPRMKREARFHHELLNQKAKGPFKHFWGTADRYQAGYNSYSLFLATGVPFEVCDELASDGWTFLGDASADEMERGALLSPGTRCVARTASSSGRFQTVAESFETLFAFRRPLLESFRAAGVPYVEEETPVVLGWYPHVQAVLLWNVEPVEKTIRLRWGDDAVSLTMSSLDSALLIRNSDGTFRPPA